MVIVVLYARLAEWKQMPSLQHRRLHLQPRHHLHSFQLLLLSFILFMHIRYFPYLRELRKQDSSFNTLSNLLSPPCTSGLLLQFSFGVAYIMLGCGNCIQFIEDAEKDRLINQYTLAILIAPHTFILAIHSFSF